MHFVRFYILSFSDRHSYHIAQIEALLTMPPAFPGEQMYTYMSYMYSPPHLRFQCARTLCDQQLFSPQQVRLQLQPIGSVFTHTHFQKFLFQEAIVAV